MVGGAVPELTVNGFVVAAGPPLTVAEWNVYGDPAIVCGVMKLTVQLVSAFQVRLAGVV